MDIITKAIIVCLIIFYLISMKMAITGAGFSRKNGKKFSILAFEFPKSKAAIKDLILDLDTTNNRKVIHQLNDDYVFMVSAYIGIALICYKARSFANHDFWFYTFTWLARLQVLPFMFDIIENLTIKNWLKEFGKDKSYQIKSNLNAYKSMVWVKFIIAFAGALLSIGFLLTIGWCK